MKAFKRFPMFFAVLSLSLLFGCASVPPAGAQSKVGATPATDLSTVQADVANAIAIAKAGNDAPGVACWTTVQTWVGTLPIPTSQEVNLPPATGPAGTIETLRIKRINLDNKMTALKTILAAGLPQNVQDACAIYANDVAGIAGKVLGTLGLAGLAAGG